MEFYERMRELRKEHGETQAQVAAAAGMTDLLIMSAGPYKHHSCMSAYCVDAQEMADAVGMICWGHDGKIRYFSQILFHENSCME